MKGSCLEVLLDTHAFLWWIDDDDRLSAKARQIIENGDNKILVSAASAWEISIKAGIGKLRLPADPDPFITKQLLENGFSSLPITISHALQVHSLPDLHRDPFDRMLIAQCIVERLPIISMDPQLSAYPVNALW